MDSAYEWQSMLRFQETLYLCLIWMLAVSACLLTFVCVLSLWAETFRSQRRPEPRSLAAANPAGSFPTQRVPEHAEVEILKLRVVTPAPSRNLLQFLLFL